MARGTGLAGFGMFVQKLSAFAIFLLQVRYLGLEKYGAFAITLGITTLLMVPQNLGLINGLSKFSVQALIDKNAERLWAIFWSGLLLPLLMGLIIGSGFIAVSSLVNDRFYQSEDVLEAMFAFGIALPILGVAQMPAIMTVSFETNRYSVISKDIVALATELTVLLLLFLFPGRLFRNQSISAIIAARAIGQLMCIIFATYYFTRLSHKKKLKVSGGVIGHIQAIVRSFSYVKKAVVYCLPLLMGGAFQRIIQWTDTIMIGSFLSIPAAGAYRIAVQLAGLLTSVLHATGSIFGPMVARYHHLGQTNMIARLYSQSVRWTLIGLFPFAVVLVVYPESFLMVLNKEAIIAFMALRLLVFGQVFNSFTGNVGKILTMAGKPHWHAINGVVVASAHVLFCLLLIPRFGMIGAASATALAVVLLNSMRVIETKKFFGFHCVSRPVLQTFIPAAAAFAVLFALRYFGVEQHPGHFLVVVFGSTVISCTFVWGIHFIFCLNGEDRQFIQAITVRIFKGSAK